MPGDIDPKIEASKMSSIAVLHFVIGQVVFPENGIHPLLIVKVPGDGGFKTGRQVMLRSPSQPVLDRRTVECISEIMSRPVSHKANQFATASWLVARLPIVYVEQKVHEV